jgi:hypothetical protein
MTEERIPYEAGQSGPAAHQHRFHVAFGGKLAIRYCESCGKSWALSEMRDLISNRTVPCWNEILEENEARTKLDEEAQKFAIKHK